MGRLTVNQVKTFQLMITKVIPNPHRKSRLRDNVRIVPDEPETPVSSSMAVATGNERRSYSIHCFRRSVLRQRWMQRMAMMKAPHQNRTENSQPKGKLFLGAILRRSHERPHGS